MSGVLHDLDPTAARLDPRGIFRASMRRPLASQRRSLRDRCLNALCWGVSGIAMIPVISLLYLVIHNGAALLSWKLFTGLPPAAGVEGGGFGNAIAGTALMVGMAMAMAAPVGVLTAIYICEYRPASPLARAVRFSAKILTGIPSIICGAFAFAVVVMPMVHFSALAGSVALAVLALPTIILTSEQALLGIPAGYREASYALGATRFQTIRQMVIPEAIPGIGTGLMLALARAAGETAPLLCTSLFNSYWSVSPFEQVASLSVLIFTNAALPYGYQVQLAWTASLVLILLVTAANLIAQRIFGRRR